MVGNAIATKLVQLGHQIMMGSRTSNSDAGQEWLRSVGGKAQIGTFADAASVGEIVLDCTNGANSIAALRQSGAANLAGKILIQVGNPLDFSKGMPPTLTVCNTDSLGEQTQREFPDVRVVKALNTVNCDIMIEPSRVPGDHDLFICGTPRRRDAQSPTGSANGAVGKLATSSTSATSRTRAAQKCSSRSGCDCGVLSATRISTSTSFVEGDTNRLTG